MPQAQSLPPLNALRAFEAAARLQNLAKAAAELHVTQGAVSQQIKLLEQYLDTQLFYRRAKGLELTDSAKAYLPVLTQAFTNMQATTNELFVSDYRPTIKVACGTTFAQCWLMPRLPKFFAKHPEFRVRLLSSAWPTGQGVNDADVEICHGEGGFSGYRVQRIIKEDWMVIASPSFIETHLPKGENQFNDLDQIKSLPLISTLGFKLGWRNWFSELGEEGFQPEPLFESNHTSTALEMAQAGVGLLLGLSFCFRMALDEGKVVKVHDHIMPAEGGQYLILSNATITPKVDAFCCWMLAELADHPDRDNLEWG
ncbi:MAG: LysR substrate-binding domain-containing protein [Marinomonas sp.]